MNASPASSQTTATIQEGNSISLYVRLLRYLKPLRAFFMLGVLGFLIYAAASTWFFDLLGELVDTIESGVAISSAQRLSIPLTLMLIVALRGFGGFLGTYYMAYIANHVVHRVRNQLLDRFVTLPSQFYDRNTAGHLMSTVTFNVTRLTSVLLPAPDLPTIAADSPASQ